MDFAIDQSVADPPKINASANRAVEPAAPSPAEVLIEAKPVRLYGSISEKNRVAVYLTDLLEHDGQVFIRFTIRNQTQKAYVPGAPQVLALNAPPYRESLYALSDSQLSADDAARLKCSGETPIEVAKGEIRSPHTEPRQATSGIVAIKLPPMHANLTLV